MAEKDSATATPCSVAYTGKNDIMLLKLRATMSITTAAQQAGGGDNTNCGALFLYKLGIVNQGRQDHADSN